jgi:uncharacterized protein YkwD
VVTETVTEYKEVTDDSDFAGFGPLSDQQHSISTSSSFPKLGSSSGPKPKTDSSSESDEEEAEAKFAEDALKAHNEYRTKHGVKPLKLNKKVRINSHER